MYRLLALLLVVLLVALQMKLWNGSEGSWTAEQDLKVQVEQQRAENAKLKERNAALEAEVEDLKTGETAVEERARAELGMVKPGETFYRVVEPQDPNASVRPEDVPEDAAHGCASAAIAGDGKDAGGRATQGAIAGCEGAAAASTAQQAVQASTQSSTQAPAQTMPAQQKTVAPAQASKQ